MSATTSATKAAGTKTLLTPRLSSIMQPAVTHVAVWSPVYKLYISQNGWRSADGVTWVFADGTPCSGTTFNTAAIHLTSGPHGGRVAACSDELRTSWFL